MHQSLFKDGSSTVITKRVLLSEDNGIISQKNAFLNTSTFPSSEFKENQCWFLNTTSHYFEKKLMINYST